MIELPKEPRPTGVVMAFNYGGQISADRLNNSLRLISDEVMSEFS